MKTKLSIIIVNWNTKELLKNCLESVSQSTSHTVREVRSEHLGGVTPFVEVIVVDNGSSDNSVEFVKMFKSSNSNVQIKLIENKKNLGFAKANNQGIEIAKGEYILLLNSDTIVKNKAIEKTMNYLESNPNIGAITCKLINKDGTTQATGGFFPNLANIFTWSLFLDDLPLVNKIIKPFHPHTENFWFKENWYTQTRQLDWITGAFFMIRKKVIDEVGKLSEDFFMYVEEVDWCYRINNSGWKIFYYHMAEITHLGGGSGKSTTSIIGEDNGLKLFFKLHYPGWQLYMLTLLLLIKNLSRSILFFIIGKPKKALAYTKALVKKK